MLVLSRKKNESIVIGGLDGSPIIEVCVVEIRGDKVRLGIAAPRDMPVHRAEVFKSLAAQQAAEPPQEPNPQEAGNHAANAV